MNVVTAKFEETTDDCKDFSTGIRSFECKAAGAKSLEKVLTYAPDQQGKPIKALAVQWKEHGRVYRATWALGDFLDVWNAMVKYEDGSISVRIVPVDGLAPVIEFV